jgi:hypothetical protein
MKRNTKSGAIKTCLMFNQAFGSRLKPSHIVAKRKVDASVVVTERVPSKAYNLARTKHGASVVVDSARVQNAQVSITPLFCVG